eukprot:GHVU01103726.1.p2 GENE.GHVU01103726.1~~GHVU01103726.1.p2  ORF type:complete len:104 (-),score=12.01 GHVU01103726.1:191-502(-)
MYVITSDTHTDDVATLLPAWPQMRARTHPTVHTHIYVDIHVRTNAVCANPLHMCVLARLRCAQNRDCRLQRRDSKHRKKWCSETAGAAGAAGVAGVAGVAVAA